MKSLLSVAHCHGGVLGTAWYLVLSTLQHLTELLNLTPSTGGSFKVGKKAKKDSTSALVRRLVELFVFFFILFLLRLAYVIDFDGFFRLGVDAFETL